MFSIWATRCGFTVLRCSPQAGAPAFFCSRQSHNASMLSFDGSIHQCPSPVVSVETPQKKTKVRRSRKSTDDEMKVAETCRYFRRFITDPGLVNSVLECLAPVHSSSPEKVIMECNPGPGILTKALLDAGHKVIALERDLHFLPSLERKQSAANEQLKVIHGDFCRIDPWSEGIVKPPTMYSTTLMKILNFTEFSWDADVPLKVFLTLDHKQERVFLWRQIYLLYERLSVFRIGRIELNVFMTETQYLKLTSRPGEVMKYFALSVLYQAAFDMELMHKTPMSSFMTPLNYRAVPGRLQEENLCLVRMRPRKSLFSENFTPMDGKTFIHVVKQILAKRKTKLIEKLDSLTSGNGKDLLQSLGLPMDIATGGIYPEEYKLLFELMSHSEEFHHSLVLDENYEDIAAIGY